MRIKTVESLDSPVLIEFVMRMIHKTTAAKKFPIIGSVTIENSNQWYEIALDFNTASIGAFIGSAMTEWDITFYPQTAHLTLEYIGMGKNTYFGKINYAFKFLNHYGYFDFHSHLSRCDVFGRRIRFGLPDESHHRRQLRNWTKSMEIYQVRLENFSKNYKKR